MGVPKSPCERIGLLGCSDSFQAHNCGTLSLIPLEYVILSLPPALRFKSEYMLLSMFLPTNVKGLGQKKYYDFTAEYELNKLYKNEDAETLSLDRGGRSAIGST